MSKYNPKDNGVQLPFNDDRFINKWAEWLEYRSQRRLAKYVPAGIKATFTHLKKISNNNVETAVAIIDQSLSMGWQGLFELKTVNNGKNNTGYPPGTKPNPGIHGEGGFGQL